MSPPSMNLTRVLFIRATEEFYAFVRERAGRRGITPTDYCRLAIETFGALDDVTTRENARMRKTNNGGRRG